MLLLNVFEKKKKHGIKGICRGFTFLFF